MEQLDFNYLCRWFVGLSPIRSGTRPKNRERLQNRNVFTNLMNKNHPQIKSRLSDEHFR